MTTELKIDITNEALAQLNYIMDANNLPETKNAFDHVVHNVQSQWRAWASGETIDGIEDIKNPNNKLVRSINTQNMGDFHSIVSTDNKYMERIENGTPQLDMKQTYPYGKKSRVSKKKVPYLIIPFRWGSGKERAHFRGNVAPNYLVNYLKKLKVSERLAQTHNEKNFRGENIPRSEYNWGGRVTEEVAQDDRQVGMVRMRDLNGKGMYFTFRIISANSPADSWIRRAVAPIPVSETIARNNQKLAEEAMSEAIKKDILSL